MIMALMPTDFPDPVNPPMSRCGMRARSATNGLPRISTPRARVSRDCARWNSGAFDELAQADDLGIGARHLDADGGATGNPLDPHRIGAQGEGEVFGEILHRRDLDSRVEPELVGGDHRPGADVGHLTPDPELLALAGDQFGDLDERRRIPLRCFVGLVEEGGLGKIVDFQIFDELELLLDDRFLLDRGFLLAC